MNKRVVKIVLGVFVVGVALAAVILFPVGQWLLEVVEWVRGAGALGVVVFALAYMLAAALLLPGSVLTLGAGFVYGPLFGTLLVSPTSVLAATVAFLIARYVAREWVARKVSGSRRFDAIDAAVGANGLKLVTLLRLSPVLPFNLLNYGLGLTKVRLRDYVLGSWIGMLPATVLYVYLGSLITNTAQLLDGSKPDAGSASPIIYWGGFAVTLLAAVVLARIAKRALDSSIDPEQSASPAASETTP